MTYRELREAIVKAAEAHDGAYGQIGFRFDAREYQVGEILDFVSKANLDRDDERDFPEYGTNEYNEMDDLDGVSAYDLDMSSRWAEDIEEQVNEIFGIGDYIHEDKKYSEEHIYILGTNQHSNDYAEDEYEIIMPEPTVLAVIA